MKQESVRLIHAQGVPNHYVTNQIYQPVDEDHKARGSFVILFDHGQSPDGAFVASLINILIRDYYRHHDTDHLTAFEQALVRLNEQIKHYFQKNESVPAPTLDGALVLLTDNELHITHIGTVHAWLARDNDLIPLSDPFDGDASTTAKFSVITSGEIFADDELILVTGLNETRNLSPLVSQALQESTVYETGRALARSFREENERTAEAVMVRFTTEADTTAQIYVDKALETPAEKVAKAQQSLAKHGSFLVSGAQFLAEKATVAAKNSSATLSKPSLTLPLTKGPQAAEPAYRIVETESSLDPIYDQSSPDTSEPLEPSAAASADAEPESHDFQVRTYWQQKQDELDARTLESASPEKREQVKLQQTAFTLNLSFLKPRTIYLLIGALVLLFIIIKISNSFIKDKPETLAQTAVERDTLIEQAEANTRDAEVAQLNDDTALTIDKLLIASDALAKVTEKNQNEKSKALDRRIKDMLATSTKTTALNAGAAHTLATAPHKVVSTTGGTYSIPTTSASGIQKFDGTTVKTISGLPTDLAIIDASAYDKFQKVALLTKKGTEYSVYIITNEEIKAVTKTDNKPWPDARLLATFEANLYPVGSTMFKAVPSSDKFRMTAYASGTTTDQIKSIVNNGPGFYAIEKDADLVRIASNSPKTATKLFGVPERFLPKKITRLISTRQDGTLYFFDQAGQRILLVSTDGGYRSQYTLPATVTYTDCDATETTFVCATNQNQIQTLEVPKS